MRILSKSRGQIASKAGEVRREKPANGTTELEETVRRKALEIADGAGSVVRRAIPDCGTRNQKAGVI